MGASQSRNDAYYNAINSRVDIDISKLNPYTVLDVPENFTWDELVKAYRQTAKKVHPDKGGNEQVFNAVTECFKTLAQEYKLKQTEKPHHILKQEYKEYKQPQSGNLGGVLDVPNFQEKFNNIFDKNKLEDENERGYGHIMSASTKEREDFKVPKLLKKFNEKKFNETFDAVVKPSKEIIIYKEPEPLLLVRRLDFTELGGKTENFSTDPSKDTSLHYTDYLQAHTTSRLIDPRAIKNRTEYKTITDYEADRNRITEQAPDEKELRYNKQKADYLAKQEEERIRRLQNRDELANEHYERVNKLMLTG